MAYSRVSEIKISSKVEKILTSVALCLLVVYMFYFSIRDVRKKLVQVFVLKMKFVARER